METHALKHQSVVPRGGILNTEIRVSTQQFQQTNLSETIFGSGDIRLQTFCGPSFRLAQVTVITYRVIRISSDTNSRLFPVVRRKRARWWPKLVECLIIHFSEIPEHFS